jgi:hypothetical protein
VPAPGPGRARCIPCGILWWWRGTQFGDERCPVCGEALRPPCLRNPTDVREARATDRGLKLDAERPSEPQDRGGRPRSAVGRGTGGATRGTTTSRRRGGGGASAADEARAALAKLRHETPRQTFLRDPEAALQRAFDEATDRTPFSNPHRDSAWLHQSAAGKGTAQGVSAYGPVTRDMLRGRRYRIEWVDGDVSIHWLDRVYDHRTSRVESLP